MNGRKRLIIPLIALLLFVLCGGWLCARLVCDKAADPEGTENALRIQSESSDGETEHSITYSLDSNRSTGYEWKATIAEGSSVSVNEYGYYQEDPNSEMADGVGGTQHFKILALKPGASILQFTYSRDAYDVADECRLIVNVDENLNISVRSTCESPVPECGATD